MKEKTVSRIREFTRFYLPALDLMGNHYLGSEYSPTEARVLYEVYDMDGCNAAHIAKKMNLDKSYLSRIIKSHEKSGYLTRCVSPTDSRAFELHLTESGRERTEDFINKSNQYIDTLIQPLGKKECDQLIAALNTVTDILNSCRSGDTNESSTIR